MGLEFANLSADSPGTVTPWAGSPGAVLMFSDHLTNSINYMIGTWSGVWMLRGRQ